MACKSDIQTIPQSDCDPLVLMPDKVQIRKTDRNDPAACPKRASPRAATIRRHVGKASSGLMLPFRRHRLGFVHDIPFHVAWHRATTVFRAIRLAYVVLLYRGYLLPRVRRSISCHYRTSHPCRTRSNPRRILLRSSELNNG